MVAFSIGCHPGLAGSWVCVHKVHTKKQGFVWHRRPPEDFRVVRQLHRSRAAPTTAASPSAPRRPLQFGLSLLPQKSALRLNCGPSWLLLAGCHRQTAGPGKVPAACHGLPVRGKGRIGGWMREIRACSWRYSRFGQQDKRWSLHTAITIPYTVFCLRCNAAMLHSLNFGTATSDWSASGRSLVKGEHMAWHGMAFPATVSHVEGVSGRVGNRVVTLRCSPLARDMHPHISSTDHGRTRPDRDKTQTQASTQTGPRHAPPVVRRGAASD